MIFSIKCLKNFLSIHQSIIFLCVYVFLSICSVANMAQYFQLQSLDDLKLYTDVQVVHVASDDDGVSNPNRAQVYSFIITNTFRFKFFFISFCKTIRNYKREYTQSIKIRVFLDITSLNGQ